MTGRKPPMTYIVKCGKCKQKSICEIEDINNRKDIQVRTAGPGVFLHSKLIIVDKRFVLLGSHNFSINSWFKNYETSVLIESPQVADVYYGYFKKIWQKDKLNI